MNILLISAGLPDKRSGGLPAYLGELIEELLRRGHRIHYMDTSRGDAAMAGIHHETTTRNDGLVVTRFFNLRALADYGRGTMDPVAQVVPEAEFLRQFEPWVDALNVDVVHVHEVIGFPAEALDAFLRRDIPVMATTHDYYPLCPTVKLMLPDTRPCDLATPDLVCRRCCRQGVSMVEFKLGSWMRRISGYRGGSWLAGAVWPRVAPLVRAATWWGTTADAYGERRERLLSVLRRLDLICAISNVSADVYRRIGGLDNVVVGTKFMRKTVRHEPPVRPARRESGEPLRVLVLNVRRGPKGLDLLRRELAQLDPHASRSLRFVAWGCARIESPLVENKGPYEAHQLDAICAEADIGLFPSLWRETYGAVGAEMLSRGLPVIASRPGAMKEYITQGEDGLLFDPLKPGDLTRVLLSVATDESLLARLTKGAAEAWSKFNTFEEHVARTESIYQDVLRRRNGRLRESPT